MTTDSTTLTETSPATGGGDAVLAVADGRGSDWDGFGVSEARGVGIEGPGVDVSPATAPRRSPSPSLMATKASASARTATPTAATRRVARIDRRTDRGPNNGHGCSAGETGMYGSGVATAEADPGTASGDSASAWHWTHRPAFVGKQVRQDRTPQSGQYRSGRDRFPPPVDDGST
jgi:hypothetical protein